MHVPSKGLLLTETLVLASILLVALVPHQTALAQEGKAALSAVVTSDGKEYRAPHSTAGSVRPSPGRGPLSPIPPVQSEPDEPPAFFDPESVIGEDGRVQVTNTEEYHWRAVAQVRITWPNGDSDGCTGWFIGPRTVATAGHCVHTDEHGTGWATSIKVYPGCDGAYKPYGYSSAHRLFSVTGWTKHKYKNYDYGAIQLNSPLGDTVGWFGFHTDSGSDLDEITVRITGYPGDKPYGTMWTDKDKTKRVWARLLFYRVDTAGGQSGAPVYHQHGDCYPCSVAIHTRPVASDPYGDYNLGVRITGSVFDNLVDWKNHSYP